MPFFEHGLLRVASASPILKVADPAFNIGQIQSQWQMAEQKGAGLVVFPELCITGYTCGDLFGTATLQKQAMESLYQLLDDCKRLNSIAIVGMPWARGNELYNVAVVLHQGEILGVVPKAFLPTYKEFYEHRWFANASKMEFSRTQEDGIPFRRGLIFRCSNVPEVVFHVEVCEDLWVPIPPSSRGAMQGATILCNLSASNDLIGKANYRRQLVTSQSARCTAAYVYSSCGVHESTTDVVFGGHCLIAENGAMLNQSQRFERSGTITYADVDLEKLQLERRKLGSFSDEKYYEPELQTLEEVTFELSGIQDFPAKEKDALARKFDAHPFVPMEDAALAERCEEIFHIQTAALARRIEQVKNPVLTMGISGGLDSTLSLLVTCKTLDSLKLPRTQLHAITMPGFGTTSRTLENARTLMTGLKVTQKEVDIRQLCLEEMRAIGHKPFGIDLTGITVPQLMEKLQQVPADKRNDLVFENVQARMRTSILMNSGFVVGTGDLSELALGWCTYNGDHMSMYNPNVSVPKTLVKFLVRWAALHEFQSEVQKVLLDVVATEISPELLPVNQAGVATQATEASVGPYELQDFYLYHFLRWGVGPAKLLWLAERAKFHQPLSQDELKKWVTVFFQRFFANQFKRSCLPDGPKVGSVSLSPRGDWRMPSDASVTAWLAELGN